MQCVVLKLCTVILHHIKNIKKGTVRREIVIHKQANMLILIHVNILNQPNIYFIFSVRFAKIRGKITFLLDSVLQYTIARPLYNEQCPFALISFVIIFNAIRARKSHFYAKNPFFFSPFLFGILKWNNNSAKMLRDCILVNAWIFILSIIRFLFFHFIWRILIMFTTWIFAWDPIQKCSFQRNLMFNQLVREKMFCELVDLCGCTVKYFNRISNMTRSFICGIEFQIKLKEIPTLVWNFSHVTEKVAKFSFCSPKMRLPFGSKD